MDTPVKAAQIWNAHPGVRGADQLTFGERASDRMKALLATWAALFAVLVFITFWMIMNSYLAGSGKKFDPYPWILLNLMLSCFAALQCFILLIANKRGEQIAAELAQHTEQNTEDIAKVLEQNVQLTQEVHKLAAEIHHFVCVTEPKQGS